MSSPLILDTHVLLWSLLQPNQLSNDVKEQISFAQQKGNLLISSISLWETAMLQFKKRVNIYEPIKDFLKSIKNISGITVKDISSDVAAESVSLIDNFHGDPTDKIIVATTRCHHATLLTRDQKILDWAKLGHIKTIQV